MGIFSSKVDVKAVEEIETNVVDLTIRLDEEEGKICYIVKKQLLRALQAYTNQIEKEHKRGYISRHKICRIKDVITRAINKLQKFETSHKNIPDTLCTFGKEPYEMKNHIFEIEKQVKNKQIKEHEYEVALKVIAAYSLKLLLNPEEEDSVAVLFLKLFLKSPCTKISTILRKILANLNETVEDFEMIHKQNINSSNVEEINVNLVDIKSKLERINSLTSERMEERKFRRSFPETLYRDSSKQNASKYDVKLLKKIIEELGECSALVEKMCAPVAEEAVMRVKNKVVSLIEIELDKVNDNTTEKNSVHKKGAEILHKLENIDEMNKQFREGLRKLKQVEEKVCAAVEADLKFEEKKKVFESLREEVEGIKVTNNEVLIQKTEISNRIEGFLTLETADYLRQMKKTLDHYKMYAQQFAFPKQVGLFKSKNEEICGLKNRFNDLSRGNGYVDKRVGSLYRNIDEVLNVLESKARSNQSLILTLEDLNRLEEEVVHIDSMSAHSLRKLKRFNEIRKQMNSIESLNKRVTSKKNKIRSLIQSVEERIFIRKFPDVMTEIKLVLNAHEKDVQEFVHPSGSESHRKKRREILALMENVKREVETNSSDYVFVKELLNTFILVVELLDNTSKKNNINEKLKSVNNDLVNFSNSCLSPPKKNEFILSLETTLKSIKMNAKGSDELSNSAADLESIIFIERSKVSLRNFFDKVRQLKLDIPRLSRPITTSTFKEKLNEILFLKDAVEDMPQDNSDLDSQKQIVLQEIFKVLQLLDEHVAKAAKSRKRSENILELQDRFSRFNPDDLGVAKNSLEFVQVIRRRAATFQDSVRFYLGTNYSVDYYIIHENLMRLLEELDNVTCHNDEKLLGATVEAMGYIKGLVEALSSNASD